MELAPRPLAFPAGQPNGLSERLLASHHSNNYSGAVKRLNAIRAQLAALDFSGAPGFQVNGLKREELIATNSMLLHELYFASLGGDDQTMKPPMALALDANFGSVDRWHAEFVAMGKALAGGSGWVLLSHSPLYGVHNRDEARRCPLVPSNVGPRDATKTNPRPPLSLGGASYGGGRLADQEAQRRWGWW